MQRASGLLKITLAKTYKHGNSLWYQRHIPAALHDRYPTKIIKRNLGTLEPTKAAKLADAIDRHLSAEFAALKANPESSPEVLDTHADALLRRWGLAPYSPDNHPQAIELLHEHFDDKRAAHADGDEAAYREAHPTEYLSPVEARAWQRLHTAPRVTIKDALRVYLTEHTKSGDAEWGAYTERAISSLLKVTGNKALADFTRKDAKRYVAASLETGNKTATVRRMLAVYRAVWAFYAREHMPELRNPFEQLPIPGEGEDTTKRQPYTTQELHALFAACRDKDDSLRWMVAMLTDTGARLAEVAGLALADIHLDEDIPFIVIQKHPWRPLKTPNSARHVPLVGAALWAAQRITATALPGDRFAFPRYTSETRCNATGASAALVKWIRESVKLPRLVHELRHTMKDRLREVECPKDIFDGIQGHAGGDVSDGYGKGYGLRVKRGWLDRVALETPTEGRYRL